MSDQPGKFRWSWVRANLIGMLSGYLLYTPIGHGLTGSHGRELSASQLFAHGVALTVVALLTLFFQTRVLEPRLRVAHWRYVAAPLLFNAAFWAGYYQPFAPGPDWDILYAFTVLGCAGWFSWSQLRSHPWRTLCAILSFPFASFVGELILFIAFSATGEIPDVQTNDWAHSLFWLTVAVVTALLGGWIAGVMLERTLPDSRSESEAHLR